MLQKFVSFILKIFMFYVMFKKNSTSGLKCEQRGLVDGKVKCVLHDRGINAGNLAINISGTLTWISELTKGKSDKELNPWKYSTGLDTNRSTDEEESQDDFRKRIRSLMPNTKWCGETGETPLCYEDLTSYVETEKCCQKHEECLPILEPKDTLDNITNVGILPRYHCSCEQEFHHCLKKINLGMANKIGLTYFTIFGPQCFRKDNPKINCTRQRGGRCLEYKYDRKKEKMFQWFDIPVY